MALRVLRWPVLISLLGLLAGCGGMSTEDAQQRCDQEREADATGCVDSEAYAACVSCYEECGDDCQRAESCPQQFVCPE